MKTPFYKVIDQNYLREPNPTLHDYLESGNYVVLTDFSGVETHKGNALINLKRSLEIVSLYPSQVVILKTMYQICRITQRGSKRLRSLLIDFETTSSFDMYCKQIYAIEHSVLSQPLAELEQKNREANQFLAQRTQYAQMVFEAIKGYRDAFPPEQLKLIRQGKYFSDIQLVRRMASHIMFAAARMMRKSGYIIKRADFAKNNYMFRWAASAYLLSIKWLSEGGYENLPIEKLQNDIIDTAYVAYATYFDGLLTNDSKMNDIYLCTTIFLSIC